jgi:hypothetical protein
MHSIPNSSKSIIVKEVMSNIHNDAWGQLPEIFERKESTWKGNNISLIELNEFNLLEERIQTKRARESKNKTSKIQRYA